MNFAEFTSECGNFITKVAETNGHLNAIVRCTNTTLEFQHQLERAEKALDNALHAIAPEYKAVFIRYFLSDISNQAKEIEGDIWNCALSIVGQPPADGSKVAIWASFSRDARNRRISPDFWESKCGKYTYYWYTDHSETASSPESLTSKMLNNYINLLQTHGCTLERNCLRTWFFVRDIDTNYHGLVKSRNEIFNRNALTADTHYIASTGIGGMNEHINTTVAMDAFAIANIDDMAVTHLHAPTHLNRTSEYGVAFERGTMIKDSDNHRVLISGTASINNKGEIMHPGDIRRQFNRAVENVEVLLNEGGTEWEDVNHLIIYLRDPADYTIVNQLAEEKFPRIPYVMVIAPVCRPGWLIEIECAALK